MKRKNNKDFNNPAPYNACDYRCEYCDKRDICIVYKKEMDRNIKHILNNKNPADVEVILDDLKEDFENISQALNKEMTKRGISIEETVIEDEYDNEDTEYEDRYVREHPLFENAQKLYDDVHQFLNYFYKNPVQGDPSNLFFEELSWYHTLILSKVYRLLSQHLFLDDERLDQFIYEETILTLESIKKTVDIMRNALENIAERRGETKNDIIHLKEGLDDVEKEIDNLDHE